MLTIELKKPLRIEWRTIQKKWHRYHQPAYKSWHDNGKLSSKQYWVNGIRDRDPTKGPAYQYWLPDGKLYREEYWVDGKLHRDPREGPAWQNWASNGQPRFKSYWVDGEIVDKPC